MASRDTPTATMTGEPPASLAEGRFATGVVLGGRYRIVSLIGRGGMGEVYRAEDLTLRQPVALKFLPASLASDPGRLARFVNEVRVARQVSHPGVCRVHDIGEAEGLRFLSMELIDGEDLAVLLRRIGRLSGDKGLEVARQICAGLAAVHAQGILHRDLKPSNVMLDGRGRVRLTDFGLAVREGQGDRDVGGTPAYMAPERLAGQPASVRSDVYALGLCLFEVFTGRPAFRADSVGELLRLQRDAQLPRPSTHVPEIDPALERAILRCLALDPAARPASALAVLAALPGGDALAAAMAAGETPDPELVADAGDEGTLRPAAAWACVAFLCVALPLLLKLEDPLVILGHVDLQKPPAVLAERARQVLDRLGHDSPVADSAFGFSYDRALLRWVERDRSPNRWDVLRQGPAAIRFWYRVAPQPLRPHPWLAAVTADDPPPLQPGMATVWLDPNGRLLEFQAVPTPTADPKASATPPDWATLIEETGLASGGLEPSQPRYRPPVYADALAAWAGHFERGLRWPLRLEAAACGGRIVSARVLGPWSDEGEVVPQAAAGGLIRGVFNFGLLGASLFFAYRNWRLGRADRAGALRIGIVAFAGTLIGWALQASHSSTLLGEWPLLAAGVGVSFWNAVLPWLFYLAIEPFVRRRWPDSLISWSRLLAGRFGDPRVGRDVLLGLVFTWGMGAIVVLGILAPTFWGEPPHRPVLIDLDHLASVRSSLAWLAFGPVRAFWTCLQMLVVLLTFRVLLRRQWLALAACCVTFAFATGALLEMNTWPERIILGIVFGLLFALVARFGILPLFVAGFFMSPRFPVTSHVTAWYGQSTALMLAAVAGLALYGLVVSVGRRPLLGGADLGD